MANVDEKEYTEEEYSAPEDENIDDAVAEDEYDGYLDVNLDDAVDLEVMEAGTYLLQIRDAKIGRKNKGPFLNMVIDFVDHFNAFPIFHVTMLPDPANMDARDLNQRKVELRDMYQALGVSYSGRIDVNELKGAQGPAIVMQKEDPEYGLQNKIKKWVAGR